MAWFRVLLENIILEDEDDDEEEDKETLNEVKIQSNSRFKAKISRIWKGQRQLEKNFTSKHSDNEGKKKRCISVKKKSKSFKTSDKASSGYEKKNRKTCA